MKFVGPSRLARRASVYFSLVLGLVVTCVQQPDAQQSGPIASFNFDAGGSVVSDQSGHGNDGSCTPSSTCPAFAATGGHTLGAYNFAGNGNYIELANEANFDFSTVFSVTLWMKTNGFTNAWEQLIGKGDSAWAIERQNTQNTLSFTTFNASGVSDNLVGTTNVANNAWHHVAVVFTGTTKTLYVDGQVNATKTYNQTLRNNNVKVRLGFNSEFTTGQYGGFLDDVRIYNRALTAGEVQTDMNTPVGGQAPPPTLSITAPNEGEQVFSQGGAIPVSYSRAGDQTSVAGIRFVLDNGPELTDTSIDGAFQLPLSPGSHTLLAYLVRADGSRITGADDTVSFISSIGADPATQFSNEIILSGLNLPTNILFTPDGRMLIGELGGKILILQPGASAVDPVPFLQLTNIGTNGGQQGLMDIELDPNFATNGFYYVFYTQQTPNRDRVSRFTAQGNTTVPGSEVVLYQDPQNADLEHHGGSIFFGPGGKFFITTGEHFTAANSQLLTNCRGKLLRFNPDGTVPIDNPYYDGSGPNCDAIFALGLRNPFRASYDAPSGRIFIGDVGGNDPATAYEEINVNAGVPGANYGWPNCEGPCAGFTSPLFSYAHAGRDASVTGGFVYRGTQFPDEFQGSYFYADYVQSWIRRLSFDASGNVTGNHYFIPFDATTDGPYGNIVHLTMGPDGSLYYTDLGYDDNTGTLDVGKIHKVTFHSGDLPPIAVSSASPTSGPKPLSVQFTGSNSSDPEGQLLTYAWNFGDGQTSTEANPLHVYLDSGTYTVHLTVSDSSQSTLALPLTIRVGTPPMITQITPADGSTFVAGDHIVFSAEASDSEDGVLPASAFTWQIDFLHDTHVHPGPVYSGVTGGTFDIPTSGHDFQGNTRYRIVCSVVDSEGLVTQRTVTIWPQKVNLTFSTQPAGLQLTVDGVVKTTPFVFDTLIGFTHTIGAPNQQFGGQNYIFHDWSDAGTQTHAIVVPATNQSLLSRFDVQQPTGTPGLLAAFNFNTNGNGVIEDRSGNNNTGACTPATTCPAFSATGGHTLGAYNFAGNGNYIEVANEANFDFTTKFSVTLWMKASSFTNRWEQLIGKGDSAWALERNNNQNRLAFTTFSASGSDSLVGTTNIANNAWHHVAIVYDGAFKTLYVDGQQNARKAYTATMLTNNLKVRLGFNEEFTTGQYGGFLDDVRIYNRALTLAEVQADMTTPVP